MTGIRSRCPATVLVFLGYAFLLLAVESILLRWVIDQATNAPVSPIGLVWMVLLACTILTPWLRSFPSFSPQCCSSPLPARPPAPTPASPDRRGHRCD